MIENINTLLQFVIVGSILSVVAQLIKSKYGLNGAKSKLLVLSLALVVGGGFYWLQSTPYLNAVLGILGASSLVYGYIVKEAIPSEPKA